MKTKSNNYINLIKHDFNTGINWMYFLNYEKLSHPTNLIKINQDFFEIQEIHFVFFLDLVL